MADAALYTKIYFSGAIASMVYNMGAGILRAMGDSRRPTIFLIITCILNIAADLFFILVLKLGVAGGIIFTAMTWLFSSVQDRLSTGPAAKAAPVVSAFGLYLAIQALMGMIL